MSPRHHAAHGAEASFLVVVLCMVIADQAIVQNLAAADPAAPITAIAVSPDGQYVVTGSDSGIFVRSIGDLSHARSLSTSLESVTCIRFAAHGRLLAVAGGTPGESAGLEIHEWGVANDTLRRTLLPQDDVHSTDIVTDFAWSSTDDELTAVTHDGLCLRWDSDWELIGAFRGHSRPPTAVLSWRTKNGTELLLTSGLDQTVRVWLPSIFAATGTRVTPVRTLHQHTEAVQTCVLRPGIEPGRFAEVASLSDDRTVRFWQPELGRMMRFVRLPSAPVCAVWRPDGSAFCVIDERGVLRLIDPVTAQVLSENPISGGYIYCMAAIPSDQEHAVVGGEGGAVQLIPLPL